MKEFIEVLFNSDDGICSGDAFATAVETYHYYYQPGEFISVNPLDKYKDHAHFQNENYNEFVARRADLNVTEFRNFMFEMDSIGLEEQLRIFRNSSIPFTSITYSGGKSYHAVLSVEGGACSDPHTQDGILQYKTIWRRLAAKLDREAVKMGFRYPDGKPSFIDQSCKNPSRLTRMPGVLRSNGVNQELILLTERMDKAEFLEMLSGLPIIRTTSQKSFEAPENQIETVEDFEAICPPDLKRSLKIVDWAGSEGMYPYLLRYALWAIDATNVSREALIEFMDKYTFKSLIRAGYPADKLTRPIEDAYAKKGC